jgi:hypothetical protein
MNYWKNSYVNILDVCKRTRNDVQATFPTKFRTQRLGESSLDDIITEIVRQCVEKWILDGQSVSVDAIHIEANTKKETPGRLMKHLARKIIKTFEEEAVQPVENVPEVPDYQEIPDHHEAKAVMKNYLESVLDQVEKQASDKEQKTDEIIQKCKRNT